MKTELRLLRLLALAALLLVLATAGGLNQAIAAPAGPQSSSSAHF